MSNPPCRFHPQQPLHTFCLSPECLLPMCSACISTHNEDHRLAQTHGNYIDLMQLMRDTAGTIQEQQAVLEELSAEYVEDYGVKRGIGEECRAGLLRARLRVHEELDRVLDRVVIDAEERLAGFEEEMRGYYRGLEDSIHKFYKDLARQRTDLVRAHVEEAEWNFETKGHKTKRIDSQAATPRHSSFSMGGKSQQQSKLDHKALKTLIEYFAHSASQVNQANLLKLKSQITQLKSITFSVQINTQKLCQSLKDICYSNIEISNSLAQPKNGSRVSEQSQGRSQGTPNYAESQANIGEDGLTEIMRNNDERVRRVQGVGRDKDKGGSVLGDYSPKRL